MKVILLQDEKKLGKKAMLLRSVKDMPEIMCCRKKSVWKLLPRT